MVVLKELLINNLYKLISIKNFIIIISFILFIVIYNKWTLAKFFKETFKLNSELRLVIFSVILYSTLELIPAFIETQLTKLNLIAISFDACIISFVFSLAVEIYFNYFDNKNKI